MMVSRGKNRHNNIMEQWMNIDKTDSQVNRHQVMYRNLCITHIGLMLTMPWRGSWLSWIIFDAGNRNFEMSCTQSSCPYFFLSTPSQVKSARQRRRWPARTHWKAAIQEVEWTSVNHSSSVCIIWITSTDRASCSYTEVRMDCAQ